MINRNRRRFLFVAPAIVAATSLMPISVKALILPPQPEWDPTVINRSLVPGARRGLWVLGDDYVWKFEPTPQQAAIQRSIVAKRGIDDPNWKLPPLEETLKETRHPLDDEFEDPSFKIKSVLL